MTSEHQRWYALGVIALATTVHTTDTLILNTAIPTLERDLHASPA